MARECRAATGAHEVHLVCGRDAAERIIAWDYGAACPIEEQLGEYQLLVAPRNGPYIPPPHLAARVHPLALDGDWREVSSSEARRRLRNGAGWTHLVPGEIAAAVREAYS